MKKKAGLLSVAAGTIGLSLVLAGCGDDDATSANEEADGEGSEAADREDWPEKFVYGLVPGEDPSVLESRWDPMREYLEDRLGIEVEFFHGTDYTAMIEAMRAGHVHTAHFGPFAYVLANERADIEAFSMGINSLEDAAYNSIIIALEDSGIDTLEDLEGKDFAWVDPTSASGHLFPKAHIINELGMTNDEVDDMFGNVVFAGGHDSAFISVLNGDVDAAGVADFIIGNLEDTHGDHPNYDNIKIVSTSGDIPRGPDAYLSDLPDSFKEELEQAFFDMVDQPELEEFLSAANFEAGWIPADDSDFDIMRETAAALGMSPEELMN
ncbi:phosphate/phosphite/phosphonate ABC transporter substrate-binding protein [Alteribacter natronophilus]|uniref:phosphate/phosphite/phosphonate ABC transporter substrate-binding protein n=1 Tax=Alteribacter natronophilus TaxID=2583810 RepID=UPI00110EF7B8|nr:phosphate/phosphite/phosphonate ABC transporter substrate-binding protein [Alteribacter natronophilus]TMW72736.1 phosphate/phosphite/phosphonate ABC transporter substrate-binding protein [Alteribacter natronophilus]